MLEKDKKKNEICEVRTYHNIYLIFGYSCQMVICYITGNKIDVMVMISNTKLRNAYLMNMAGILQ
jgi:hypothetical protein